MLIGYARVSDRHQNISMQLHALKKYGCKKIFQEKKSGKTTRRMEYQKAIDSLKPGDTLVFWHIDRLGRNARELINLEYDLREKGIHIVSLTQYIETKTVDGRYHFHKCCAEAEYESGRISVRTTSGLRAAANRGHYPGHPKRLNAPQVKRVRVMAKKDALSVRAIARKIKCSPATVWRALQLEYTVERKERHACRNPKCDRVSCIRKRRLKK